MFSTKIEGSLDIGSGSIKGVKIKGNKVEKVEIETLPQGAILSGNIEDHLAVTDSLRNLVSKLELKGKNIVVSLPIQNFFVKFITIVRVGDKERLAIIESELEELIPNFDPDEYITEYVIVGGMDGQDDIMALTIQKEKIEDIIEILTSIKVKPMKITADFISLFNLWLHTKPEIFEEHEMEHFSTMIVDIGAEATKFFIEQGGFVKMQRIAAIGGNDFTDVIERYQSMEYDEAEKVKRGLEIKEGEEEGFTDEMMVEIGELVEELTNQVQRSIEYYKAQEGLLGIDSIIVTGGTSMLDGYREVLEQKIMLELKDFAVLDFFSGDEEVERVYKNNIKRFDVVIGNIIDEVTSQ